MSKTTDTGPREKTHPRVNRSISFEHKLLNYLKEKAKRDKRSVNWLVNDLIRQDTEEV